MPDISICIPVFNFPVEPLVIKLLSEITNHSVQAEIVIIDDASHAGVRVLNEQLAQKYSLHYIQLNENIGRSAIRNLFTDHTNADVLLFLDCDVMPVSENFVHNYLSADPQKKMVICGGISYAKKAENNKKLHWKFGSSREAISADKRNKHPHRCFLTGSFLLPKNVLQRIRFNEDLEGYGYEDTLYGIELERNDIAIRHIDLPVEHLRLDDAKAFIEKTENALQNLSTLYQNKEYDSLVSQYVRLIRVYNNLKKYKLIFFAYVFYKIRGKRIRRKLMEGNTNLRQLDLYKLLFFIALQKNTKP